MMSKQLQKAYEDATEHDKTLTAGMFCYDTLVTVKHEDGTEYHFRYAFVHQTEEFEDYLFVYTEHNGFHVYHKADLEYWQEWKLQSVEDCSNYGEENDS